MSPGFTHLHRFGLLVAAALVAAPLGAAPRVEAETLEHAFGEVRIGAAPTHAFALRNAGDSPLFLKFKGATVKGVTARAPREVAPGAEAKITLTWDTSAIEGESEAEVVYATSDPANPELVFRLSVVAYAPIAVEPIGAAYFSLWRGEGGVERLRIVVRDERPARITRVVSDSARFTAEVVPIVEGREYELVVRALAGSELGRFRERLTLESDRPDLATVGVGVNILVKPELYVSEEEITFGELDAPLLAGRPDLVALLLKPFVVRRKEGPFELLAVDCAIPGVTVTVDPLTGASDRFRIDVGIDPARLVAGAFDGAIRIATSDPRFPEIRVPVRGSVARALAAPAVEPALAAVISPPGGK